MRILQASTFFVAIFFAVSVRAGTPPGPAEDQLFAATFEGIGWMRNFAASFGFVVPDDGLPVMLQDDFDALYLAKCTDLDCAAGASRTSIGRVDNQKRAALALGSDGLPMLAYWDSEISALQFGRCEDASCEKLTTKPVFIGDVIEMNLISGADGFPLISLFDGEPFVQDLLLIKCHDLACGDFSPPVKLNEASTGARIAMGISSAGLPVLAYSRVEFLGGGQSRRTLTVTTCDSDDCGGNIRHEPIDDGILFEEISFGTWHTSLSMVIPESRPPLLIGLLSLAGNQELRIVSIACNTESCDDVEDPEILGSNGNYQAFVSSELSADGLPMVMADVANSGVEFIQCQTADCSGARTNRFIAHPKIDSLTTNAVLTVAADGNPIAAVRGRSDSAGVVYCRDPECAKFAIY